MSSAALVPDPVPPVLTTAVPPSAPALTPPGWTVRRGGLLDVNPVVRLLRVGANAVDVDGDGELDGPRDEEAASAAARMLLLHVVLERGELWVAERAPSEPSEHDGDPSSSPRPADIVAASIWLPGSELELVTGQLDSSALVASDLRALLTRELRLADVTEAIGPPEHVRPQVTETMTGLVETLTELHPRLVLFAVTVAPQLPQHELVEVARAVVGPVTDRRTSGGVVAVALDEGRARLLRATGFAEVGRVPLGELNEVWIGRAAAPISA